MKRFNTGLLLAAAVLIICHGFPSYGKEEKEGFIEYTVSFVDAADHDNRIFNSQQGQAPEGTAIHVSFPKQIIGADGHIWRAVPRNFSSIRQAAISTTSNTGRVRR